MIYVPDLENYKCYVVKNEEVIRAYEEIPTTNTDISYRDYYYNSNYLYTDGVETFADRIPTCLDASVLSNDVWYRNDYDKILIIFICMCFIIFYPSLKILFRFFRRSR